MAREMKDSGIEWIGEIPTDWKIGRTKNCYVNHKDIVGGAADDYERLALTLNGVIKRPKDDSTGLQPEAFNSYQILREHELVFKLIDLANIATSRVGYSPYLGLVSPAYIVLHPYEEDESKYGVYYFLSMWQREIFNHMGDDGVRSSLNAGDLLNIPYPIIPIEDRQRIVSFLDVECSRIDSVIEQTRASIEEYKKLKQAVITQAVTKGIRPDRQMKDSGIEWIGEIPVDWNRVKLKYYSTIRSGITLGKVYPAGTELFEYPYLRVANVQGSHTDLSDVAVIKVTAEEAIKYRLQSGELLMTEGGDRDKLGRGSVWHAEIDPCLHQNHVFALRTNEDRLLAEYLSYITDSYVGRDYFDVTANQSVHLASTNSTTIMDFMIPFPSIEEQKEIVAYLDKKVRGIDVCIEQKNKLISELDSYKKSLIYEYVTGKKEVPA